MPDLVWTDAFVSVNGVDLSSKAKQVTLTYGVDAVENTTMGVGTHVNIAGLKTWSLSVQFNQDFAAGSVDATLGPLVGAAPFTVAVRPVKASGISATNPQYEGNAILSSYNPLDGSVGDLAVASAEFAAAGALTRRTL